MAKKDDGIYHNFRLSRHNPVHVKINTILMDINKDVYKSKNQFIADALEYYINALEGNCLTNKEQSERAKREGYVTRKEIDQIKKEIYSEVINDVHKEIIGMLGRFTGNMASTASLGISQNHENNGMENKDTIENDEDKIDERLIQLASNWA